MKPAQEQMPDKDLVALLRDVLETNHNIVKQNALIIQSLTLPKLIVKADEPWEEL